MMLRIHCGGSMIHIIQRHGHSGRGLLHRLRLLRMWGSLGRPRGREDFMASLYSLLLLLLLLLMCRLCMLCMLGFSWWVRVKACHAQVRGFVGGGKCFFRKETQHHVQHVLERPLHGIAQQQQRQWLAHLGTHNVRRSQQCLSNVLAVLGRQRAANVVQGFQVLAAFQHIMLLVHAVQVRFQVDPHRRFLGHGGPVTGRGPQELRQCGLTGAHARHGVGEDLEHLPPLGLGGVLVHEVCGLRCRHGLRCHRL